MQHPTVEHTRRFWIDPPNKHPRNTTHTSVTNVCAALALLFATSTSGHAADEFFAGKTINLLIPFASGSGYDTYGRALARHISHHIPGSPTIVPSNMIGGGGLVLANNLFNISPKDGTAIGMLSRSNVLDTMLGNPAARFDPRKFSWIGSISDEVSICASWHTSGFNSWQDLGKKEFIAASSGIAADNGVYPMLFNKLLDTKFKVVAGYKGGPSMNKAMEDTEVHGRCGWSWSSIKSTKLDWYKENKIVLLLQAGMKKAKDLPNVPLVLDLAKNKADRQALELAFAPQAIAWGVAAPPGVPAERMTILRKAFMDTLADKAFKAEADRLLLDVDPMPADEVAALVDKIYQTPKESVDIIREVMFPKKK